MANPTGARSKPATLWGKLSLRLKGLVVIAIPVAALISSAVLVTELVRTKDHAQELMRRNWDLRAQLLNSYIYLSSAESATRNFALTGKESGLQSIAMLETSVDAVFDRMGALILDNAEQTRKLADFRQKVRSRAHGMQAVHEFYEQHAQGEPLPPALADAAKISPDLLRDITTFFTAETKVLQERLEANRSLQAKIGTGLFLSFLVGLLGSIGAAILFTRGIVLRVRLLESRAGNLEHGMTRDATFDALFHGNDELCRLAAAMEKAGQILANQDRELQTALENAQLLIWDLDTVDQRILYHAGPGSSEASILPVELLEPTVAGWISAVHPDDRDRLENGLRHSLSEGGPLQVEYRVVIRGGQIRWMMVKAQRCDSGVGKPERFLGILADVTERRIAAIEIERQASQLAQSREALESQTRILKSILDSMGDGVVVADVEGKFLVFNPAAQQILGTRGFSGDMNRWAEHYGLFLPDCETLCPVEQLPFVRAIHGTSVDDAELFVRPAGSHQAIWTSITARPLRQDDGAIRGGVMVLRDITAAKHNANALESAKHEAEEANQAKSEFLSRMSHELRTPLNSILGFAQLLELANLDERDSDNLKHILKGGYHLLDLINEILDLARIESGRLSLSPEPVRMLEALNDALDLVRPLAQERNIHISLEGVAQCDHHVRADRQRLKQVLLNLLSNAVKYNRQSGSIAFSCSELPDNRLRLEVADSGCGISVEGIKKLFTPFERLAAERSDVNGSGLGLALSKRLVEAMGGTIGVESAVGLGSKFFIELDLLDDPAAWLENNPEALEDAHRESISRRGTILYIEDNASNLRLIERIIDTCPDVRLITAMQGQLGLDLAQMHVPDWILLDLHLPDIGGDEVLRRLRANPRTNSIPVTMLSADATKGQIARMLKAGAREYLTKPVDVRQLLALLDQTLKQTGPRTEEVTHAERNHPE